MKTKPEDQQQQEEPKNQDKPEDQQQEEPKNQDKPEDQQQEEPKNQDKPEGNQSEASSSSKTSALKEEIGHLREMMILVTEKTDKTFQAAKEAKEELGEAANELRETTQLLQSLIGDMDERIGALESATEALIIIHQQQAKNNKA